VPTPDGNFASRLLERLGRKSDLIDAAIAQTIPAADVPSLIVGFAAGFRSVGLRPGNRVLISCGVDPLSVLAYIGAMYAGCVPVPVDERTLTHLGDSIVAKAQASAAWTGKGARWDWSKKRNFPLLEGPFAPLAPDRLRAAPCTYNDLAALMPTSGSTGTPRLVMVTHGNLIANTEAIIRSQSLGTDERAMLIMPVSYCFGASIVHTHLYQGGGVVFDSRFMFPDKVLRAINTHGCTSFAGVPTIYNILLKRSNLRSIALPNLRRFLQAGGPLASENVEALCGLVPNAKFFVMYGQTEATARITCLPPKHLSEKLGSVGPPLDNLMIRIVDDKGHELANGQTGEIQVSGPSICKGYLSDPDATEGKFDNGWLKTGDLGFRDENGYIWIKGRISEFTKIRGMRVSFAEVEAKVAAIPGIYECAATAVHHPEAGEALALFIVAGNRDQGIVETVRHALPPQWTCTSVKVVSELPRTTNGKIVRSKLQTLI
jgi:acyl-CoA synthetase (AMP-forming)/AMP-acid ligase II